MVRSRCTLTSLALDEVDQGNSSTALVQTCPEAPLLGQAGGMSSGSDDACRGQPRKRRWIVVGVHLCQTLCGMTVTFGVGLVLELVCEMCCSIILALLCCEVLVQRAASRGLSCKSGVFISCERVGWAWGGLMSVSRFDCQALHGAPACRCTADPTHVLRTSAGGETMVTERPF